MIYLALMFASGIIAICAAVATHDVTGSILAVGTLAACCLGLAYGHDALPTAGRKRRRAERAAAEAAFEQASHEAYLRLCAQARASRERRRAR